MAGILVCVLIIEAYSAPVLISQVLKGRVFGSPSSNDVAKRIVVGTDGSLYIGGVTTPGKNGDLPWGDVEAGEVAGKRDIFLAKLTSSGELVWLTRTGSSENDTLSDLKVARNGLYVCGSTQGKLGIPSQGSSDAFVMKFSLGGSKVWRHPFQFGSRGVDTCRSIHVDPLSNAVYVTGNTNGRMFGTVSPGENKLHYFVATFEELGNDPLGLKLIKGRQQGSHGSCSSDGIVATKDWLFIMTSTWNEHWDKQKAATYLNVLNPESLKLQKLFLLKTNDSSGFHGVRMAAVNETDDIYVAGIASESRGSRMYYVLKFSLRANGGRSGIEWATRVGSVSPHSGTRRQVPSIVVDPVDKMVYVAGVEDGYFTSGSNDSSGIVSVPFLKLNMADGKINETWHRTTTVPIETEELTDIALDPRRAVVYTGVWDGGPELHANVLIGSFGSPGYSSRTTGSKPVSAGAFVQAGGEKTESKGLSKGGIVGYVLLGFGGVGIALTALYASSMRSSKRKINLDDEDANLSEMETIRKQVADSHRETGYSQTEAKDIDVGGSSNPQ